MMERTPVAGFGFLCWNIQKRSLAEEFRREFLHLLKHYPSDIIALQEVKIPETGAPGHFQPFSRALSCNFVRNRHHFGVMTLSKLPLTTHSPFTTKVREAVIATKKSALLSRHTLPGGETLALLNLHAINFVPHRLFVRELTRISEWIGSIEERYALVAGDFNTWSRKRQISLDGVMREHGLERLMPENEKSIKSILGMPLDHIYYRGLTPLAASVIDTPISDHNPIYARFSVG
ncbi:endonuclease/exonuclease/phosphatase family protein [Hydrogenimonas sp.]